ncbi:MAG: DHH family phosphoesterase [Methanomassiliicoccaceae archaeon]|jgi:nanoRNase/pAp phosphatase (c-di-AMP/oligoRNAs hydrolase)|nr:DHH family phosphoesterase [Methanomassiliicoccaceae archaeon]
MLADIAEALKGKNKAVVVHGNADTDAVGSAYAIAECFPPAVIYAPGGVDRVAKIVTDKLNVTVLGECDLSDYELMVVVDTSSPEQFKPGTVQIPKGSVVIDHHTRTDKWKDMMFVCDESKVACCELVYDIIRASGADLKRDVGMALLCGMLTDSGHFSFANTQMMRTFAEIMDITGIGMDEAMDFPRSEVGMSERIAVMKGMERSRFDRVGDMIVAVSYGGSFEASVCKALLNAGADVVFVGSQREDQFRLSARADQDMVRRGIHLGEIMKDIGRETVTDGGGHSGAAGLSGTGDVEAMLHICMQRTMNEFRKMKKEGSDLTQAL